MLAMRLDWNKILFVFVLLLWGGLFFISINHLFPFFYTVNLSTTFIGFLGWLTFFSSLICISKNNRLHTVLVFLFFLCFGYLFGPFLEPPSDPFEHLKRIHSICNINSNEISNANPSEISQVNSGFWHYSMAGILICSDPRNVIAGDKLKRIDATHGLFLGALMSTLFVLARNANLAPRWAFFSILVAFMFFGTNRISYFTYYSLAPSFTSMIVCWIWTALFFFRSDRRAFVNGMIIAFMSLPVLWLNHRQEAVFVGFLVVAWGLLNAYPFLLRRISTVMFSQDLDNKLFGISTFSVINIFLLSFFVFFFFALPQFDLITNVLSRLFVRDLWQQNQDAIMSWNGIHFFGKIWSYRINDTLGNIGILIAFISIPYFYPGIIRKSFFAKVKIYTLAVLPFIGYCVPLFNFIWASNVYTIEYFRLCYISMFWLLFADMLQGVEGRFYLNCMKITNWCRRDVA